MRATLTSLACPHARGSRQIYSHYVRIIKRNSDIQINMGKESEIRLANAQGSVEAHRTAGMRCLLALVARITLS